MKFGAIAAFATMASVQAADFTAGFAQRDISPTAAMIERREVWQGGYGFWKTRGIPKGVNDPIKSIATVISDVNNSTVAMVILDTTGIGNTIHDRIVNGVEAATGIPADNVLLGATHTHSGPDLQDYGVVPAITTSTWLLTVRLPQLWKLTVVEEKPIYSLRKGL